MANSCRKALPVSRCLYADRLGWFSGRRSELASFDPLHARAIWSRRQHVHPRRGTLIAIPLSVAWVSAQCRIHFRRQLMPLSEQAEKAKMRDQVHQPAMPISDQSFPRISTGSRFGLFHLRHDLRSSLASPQSRPYATRVKVPSGAPRKHSEARLYTVISGASYIGVGSRFDADRLQADPPVSSFCPATRPIFTGKIQRVRQPNDRYSSRSFGPRIFGP